MGSSIGTRMEQGKVVGTAADIDVALLWTPRKVELYNADGVCYLVWSNSMGDGAGMKTVDSGVGTTDVSFITTGGVTPLEQVDLQDGDRGFTIGADTDLNVGDEVIHWVAYE